MNSRLNSFEMALKKCEAAFSKNPNLFPLEWIIRQLKYLIDLEKGATHDLTGLDNIRIGWIATRELDGWDDKNLINELCTLDKEAQKMKSEKKSEK